MLFRSATNFNDGIFFNTWNATSIGVWDPNGGVYVRGGLWVDDGAYGTFTSNNGKTISVRGGIVVEID